MSDQEREDDFQTSVAALGISPDTLKRLQDANMYTIGHLARWLSELGRKPIIGISPTEADALRQSLMTFRDRSRAMEGSKSSPA